MVFQKAAVPLPSCGGRLSPNWSPSMKLLIEASVGEVLDKITILRIKRERISDPSKLANVKAELTSLEASLRDGLELSPALEKEFERLQEVNRELWDIEDRIRGYERRREFGVDFVALARQVYITNDRRSASKRRINELSGSRLVEEKAYADD